MDVDLKLPFLLQRILCVCVCLRKGNKCALAQKRHGGDVSVSAMLPCGVVCVWCV